jgi:lipopolysaccharide export system protein LptC
MSGAEYHGVDQRGQPFTLTANTADEQGKDNVVLAQPEGDITLTSGAWLVLKSDAGLFHQSSQRLGLNGNVTLYRNDGTVMTVSAADIDLKAGSAASTQPVQVAGPFGTLNAANGFNLTGHGDDIMFNGPVVLLLANASAAGLPQ